MVPETGIEPVRPLFTKRRILSPMCLPISPLRLMWIFLNKNASQDSVSEANQKEYFGGAVRSRTGLTGFAIRGITALLPRHFKLQHLFTEQTLPLKEKWEAKASHFLQLERDKRLELSTYTLARYRSTN